MDNTLDDMNGPEWVKAITPTRDDIDWYKDLLIKSSQDLGYFDEGLLSAFFQVEMRGINAGVRADRLDLVLYKVKQARAVMYAYDEVCNGVP